MFDADVDVDVWITVCRDSSRMVLLADVAAACTGTTYCCATE